MTGALFSEKCARGHFSAPFAQWRSPNASLRRFITCSAMFFAKKHKESKLGNNIPYFFNRVLSTLEFRNVAHTPAHEYDFISQSATMSHCL